MRSLSLNALVVIALATVATAACDSAVEAPVTGQDELALVAPPEPEPVAVPMCRAAATTAYEAIEKVLAPAAACEVDADCTVTVTDTRCTGELVVAVGVEAEESFLLLADKVDARHCAEVPSTCGATVEAADAPAVSAVCVQSRCQIAE
ncbi:MAG: hypothetical protein IT385_03145 [Deltaproteobacteria bacterium]|nr:hypothetical protein [Deltaproteobacteria bacterium]